MPGKTDAEVAAVAKRILQRLDSRVLWAEPQDGDSPPIEDAGPETRSKSDFMKDKSGESVSYDADVGRGDYQAVIGELVETTIG